MARTVAGLLADQLALRITSSMVAGVTLCVVKPLGVHHVAINVPDVGKAIAFYTERLGLTVRSDRPTDLGVVGAWLDAADQQVHLVEAAPPESAGQHFALHVDDLDVAIAELRDGGVEVSDGFAVGTDRQAFLNDPFGNTIELHQVG
jgi:catechol 2,3-dioxygenase-like lactoylglutathione lyase family enzyme